MPRIIFVTGGVVSSLGKGIAASIIGGLLKSRGFVVKIKKIDPYLNVDPGTLSPLQHGEVFVTEDGAETDLDLGHYERLGDVVTSKSDYITSGAIYNRILQKERRGDYLGQTVQVIPHVTQEFQTAILESSENVDFLICEVGGTVGDIESVPILEAARQMRLNFPDEIVFVHVALLPYLRKAAEWKTKPIQHSVQTLLQFGIQPDLILCRMEEPATSDWREKVALFCNIKKEFVLPALDADSIYHAMLNYRDAGVDSRILEKFKITNSRESSIKYIEEFVQLSECKKEDLKIAIVGKYVEYRDSYKSLEEALFHAAFAIHKRLEIKWIDAEHYTVQDLEDCAGILVPGGFGVRASEGKIQAIDYAIKHNIPYLGICFGMQLAVIQALRHKFSDASSSEFGICDNPVIARIEEWNKGEIKIQAKTDLGGSMRLGAYPCKIKPSTLTEKIYKCTSISERHRHRYEINNNYLPYFEEVGLRVSGECSGLVEIIERPDCRFFVGVQFHPEFKSSLQKPHPLFVEFLRASSIV